MVYFLHEVIRWMNTEAGGECLAKATENIIPGETRGPWAQKPCKETMTTLMLEALEHVYHQQHREYHEDHKSLTFYKKTLSEMMGERLSILPIVSNARSQSYWDEVITYINDATGHNRSIATRTDDLFSAFITAEGQGYMWGSADSIQLFNDRINVVYQQLEEDAGGTPPHDWDQAQRAPAHNTANDKNGINSKYDRVADKLDKLHSVQAAYGIKRRNHKKRVDKPMIGTLKNDKTTIGELFDMSQGEEGCPVVVLYTGRGPPAQVTVCSEESNVREADSYDIEVWVNQLKLHTDLGVSIPREALYILVEGAQDIGIQMSQMEAFDGQPQRASIAEVFGNEFSQHMPGLTTTRFQWQMYLMEFIPQLTAIAANALGQNEAQRGMLRTLSQQVSEILAGTVIAEVSARTYHERTDMEELRIHGGKLRKDHMPNEVMSNGSDPRQRASDGERSSYHDENTHSSWAKIVADQHAQIEKMRNQMSMEQEERRRAAIAREEESQEARVKEAEEAARRKNDIQPTAKTGHDSVSIAQSHVTTEQLQNEIALEKLRSELEHQKTKTREAMRASPQTHLTTASGQTEVDSTYRSSSSSYTESIMMAEQQKFLDMSPLQICIDFDALTAAMEQDLKQEFQTSLVTIQKEMTPGANLADSVDITLIAGVFNKMSPRDGFRRKLSTFIQNSKEGILEFILPAYGVTPSTLAEKAVKFLDSACHMFDKASVKLPAAYKNRHSSQNRSENDFHSSNGVTPLHNPKGPPLIGATRFFFGMTHQMVKSTRESIDDLLKTNTLDTISAITFLNDVLNPAMLKAASHSTEHSAMHVCLIYLNILVTRANLKPPNGTQKNNMKNTLDKIADKLKLDYRTENWYEEEWTDPNGKIMTVRGLTASKLTWELLLNEECKGLSSDDYITSLHNKLQRMKYEPDKVDFGTHYSRFRDALQAFPQASRLGDEAATVAFVNTLPAEIKVGCITKIDTAAREQKIPKFQAARDACLAVIETSTSTGQMRNHRSRQRGADANSIHDSDDGGGHYSQEYFRHHNSSHQHDSLNAFGERPILECKYCKSHAYNGSNKHSDVSCFKVGNEDSQVDLNLRKVWNNGNVMRELCNLGSHHDSQSYLDSLRQAKVNKAGFERAITKAKSHCDNINSATGVIGPCQCQAYGAEGVILQKDWFRNCRECKAKRAVTEAVIQEGRRARNKGQTMDTACPITDQDVMECMRQAIDDETPRDTRPTDKVYK